MEVLDYGGATMEGDYRGQLWRETMEGDYGRQLWGGQLWKDNYRGACFKHVLLISKQVKNLYKWTSIRR